MQTTIQATVRGVAGYLPLQREERAVTGGFQGRGLVKQGT